MLCVAGQTIVGYQIVNPPGGCNCDLKLEVGTVQHTALAGSRAACDVAGISLSRMHVDGSNVDTVFAAAGLGCSHHSPHRALPRSPCVHRLCTVPVGLHWCLLRCGALTAHGKCDVVTFAIRRKLDRVETLTLHVCVIQFVFPLAWIPCCMSDCAQVRVSSITPWYSRCDALIVLARLQREYAGEDR